MKSATLLTVSALVGSLAPAAWAGQQFSFLDPVASPSYSNYMFETTSLLPSNTSTSSGIINAYTGNVSLRVDNFSATGAYLSSNTVTARYYLTKSTGSLSNDLFSGSLTTGGYATGSGRIVFVDPNNASSVYFQALFSNTANTASILTYAPLATTPIPTIESFSANPTTLSFSGSLFNTTETGNPNAGFGMTNRFLQGTNLTTVHHSGTFYASIGTIGVVPVPEPAPVAALAFGAFVMLRRRRRS